MPSTSPASDASQPSCYQVDDLLIDVGRRSVARGGAEIALPGLSFDLLVALVHAAPDVLSYDQLMAQVWHGVVVNSETVTQRVKLVRDALGDDPHAPRYITGVRGRGYRLLPNPVPAIPANAPPSGAPPSSRRRFAAIAVVAGLLAASGVSWMALRTGHTGADQRRESPAEVVVTMPRSIAVLPFVDMSEDKSQGYFADGMAEELLEVLSKIPELTVIGRTSSFSFRGRNEDARTIGQKLGVTNLVEGSVRWSGNRIRVSAQLLDAHSGAQLWSDTYDRDLGDVLSLQDEVASHIARALQFAVVADSPHDNRRLRNAEAYAFFLRGRAALDSGDEKVKEAKTYFEQALALDPAFSRAQESLALALITEIGDGIVTEQIGWPPTLDAARKTLLLDPQSALAHAILGFERATYRYDWRGADEELDRVIALRPRDPDALDISAGLALNLGRLEDARRLGDLSLAIDPLNPVVHESQGYFRYVTGDLDGAEREYRTALQISPRFWHAHRMLGRIQLVRGRPEAALKEMKAEIVGNDQGYALAYHALGNEKESAAAVRRMEALDRTSDGFKAFSIALVHAYRGERDEAFEWLGKSVARREISAVDIIKYEPLAAGLRTDPRYQALLRKMNLPYEPAAATAVPPPR